MMPFFFQLPRFARLSLTHAIFGRWGNHTDSFYLTTSLSPAPGLALNSLCSYLLQWPEIHYFLILWSTLHISLTQTLLSCLSSKTSKGQTLSTVQCLNLYPWPFSSPLSVIYFLSVRPSHSHRDSTCHGQKHELLSQTNR